MRQPLHGVISDRLRALFPKGDKAWTPSRPPESTRMPKSGVQGVRLSKGRRKAG